jgi:hypothetical protein
MLGPFVPANVAPGAKVRTDGWIGYAPLAARGHGHEGNLDAGLLGTHPGVSPQHLQADLNE